MITVQFDDIDLKKRYSLTLEEFDIGIPEPKFVTVDVPGRNGELDMSLAITGNIMYHNRIIQLQFGITGSEKVCEGKRNTFMYEYQMKKVKLKFSHLTGYFVGVVMVEKVTRENQHYTLLVKVNCEPYRYMDEDFDQTITLSSNRVSMPFVNLAMPSPVTIRTTGNAVIEFNRKQYRVNKGEHQLGIVFQPGMNQVTLSGSGSIRIMYQMGVL